MEFDQVVDVKKMFQAYVKAAVSKRKEKRDFSALELMAGDVIEKYINNETELDKLLDVYQMLCRNAEMGRHDLANKNSIDTSAFVGFAYGSAREFVGGRIETVFNEKPRAEQDKFIQSVNQLQSDATNRAHALENVDTVLESNSNIAIRINRSGENDLAGCLKSLANVLENSVTKQNQDREM